MKSYFYALAGCLILSLCYNKAAAQGCVAVRQMGGVNPLSSNGYTLPKGEFQVGVNYRYFHSFRHYVGKEEQEHRQYTGGGFDANGVEKGNAVNIYSGAIDLNLSYAVTDRFQVNLAIPYVQNERSQVQVTKRDDDNKAIDGIRYSVFAKGLGDIRISGNYWLFNPATATRGNLSLGVGIKTNSGSHTQKDNGLFLNTKTRHGNIPYDSLVMMDQAIQPGDGGIGFSLELQGFKQVYKRIYGFANGYYLFNPRESNGTFKSAPSVVTAKDGTNLGTLYGYNVYASPDQYFVRAGFMGSLLKSQNLVLSAAYRFEGIPAYDAFGGQSAYRRPGYVMAIEYGASYRSGKHSFGLFIPFNFVRNRIQSAADIASQNLQNAYAESKNETDKVHVQGDAAFADYSINLNYSYRLGKLF